MQDKGSRVTVLCEAAPVDRKVGPDHGTDQDNDMKMRGPNSFKFEHATKDALN